MMRKKLVVAGGGFAGLWAALAAKRQLRSDAGIDVCLVSRDLYLTLRPRLYEADPAVMRVPLADTLDPVGVELIIDDIEDIDAPARELITRQGALIYDRLVLATGSRQRTLAVPGAGYCHDIDSYAGALRLDARLKALVNSATETQCIVIVGAGFTGIELATELRSRLAGFGRSAESMKILLIDSASAVGPELGANPRPEIERALDKAGVERRLGVRIGRIGPDGIELADGEILPAGVVVNCTGLEANPLTRSLGTRIDASGRLHVDDELRVESVADVYAAGDSALARTDAAGHHTLMSCQHALLTGRFAGHNAACDLLGRPGVPYRQPRYLTCLDLGATGAVVTQGWDRQVFLTGAAASKLKRDINTNWIYPPTGTAEHILAQAALPEEEAAA